MSLPEALRQGSLVILGKRGYGKSFLAAACARLRPNGLCIDTLGDVHHGAALTLSQIPHVARGGWGRVNVLSEAPRLGVPAAGVAKTCFRFVLKASQKNLLPRPFCLFVDEADSYGNSAFNDPHLKELARYGRHWDVSFIITARRYAEIPKDWTCGADAILAGRSIDACDAEAVKRLYGHEHTRVWTCLENRQFLTLTLAGYGRVAYHSDRKAIVAVEE